MRKSNRFFSMAITLLMRPKIIIFVFNRCKNSSICWTTFTQVHCQEAGIPEGKQYCGGITAGKKFISFHIVICEHTTILIKAIATTVEPHLLKIKETANLFLTKGYLNYPS